MLARACCCSTSRFAARRHIYPTTNARTHSLSHSRVLTITHSHPLPLTHLHTHSPVPFEESRGLECTPGYVHRDTQSFSKYDVYILFITRNFQRTTTLSNCKINTTVINFTVNRSYICAFTFNKKYQFSQGNCALRSDLFVAARKSTSLSVIPPPCNLIGPWRCLPTEAKNIPAEAKERSPSSGP